MVFQYGWFDGLLGFDSLGYVNAMTPPFLLAIVFGLSMDYEVFLLSRIRERYDATGDTRRSVAEGLRASAGTISSAALIMVAVFAVFAGTGMPSIKEIGVGMSVAIALDATLVRLILVPATMEIMGRWNWWLPKRLDRVLPHAGFEGRSAESAPRFGLAQPGQPHVGPQAVRRAVRARDRPRPRSARGPAACRRRSAGRATPTARAASRVVPRAAGERARSASATDPPAPVPAACAGHEAHAVTAVEHHDDPSSAVARARSSGTRGARAGCFPAGPPARPTMSA